jgi:cytochrome c-type biogenesis protein CcmH/NrfG
MGLEIFPIRFKMFIETVVVGFIMVFTGCAFTVFKATPKESRQTHQQAEKQEKSDQSSGLSPRAVAALQLTEQGRIFLENQRPDEAIRILERALSLNPDNGRNYYYIAEGWLMKGNMGQAAQFNRLAEIYLKDDNEWLQKVILQKKRIAEKER